MEEHADAPTAVERDFTRTGPGTVAGRYMRMFWQPIYEAHKLKAGRAVPVRVMSEDLTLYRGATGNLHLVEGRCAHRGNVLWTGWVEDDCIRCLYHGWKYDGDGQCVEQPIPTEDEAFAPKVRIRSYPVREYLGLAFAFLGEGEPPPLPRHPEVDPEVRGPEVFLTTESYGRGCNYFNALDNGVDEVHVAYTHRASKFAGSGLNDMLPVIAANETAYGIIQTGRRGDRLKVTHALMPNILYLAGPPDMPGGARQALFSWRVPVDDRNHRSFIVAAVHATGQFRDDYLERRARWNAARASARGHEEVARAILEGHLHITDVEREGHPDIFYIQDHVTQIGQGVIADRTHERLGRSDVGIILLRKIWTRELTALAEGRTPKRWERPREQLIADYGWGDSGAEFGPQHTGAANQMSTEIGSPARSDRSREKART